jgi:CheY-like chemotaxis protein
MGQGSTFTVHLDPSAADPGAHAPARPDRSRDTGIFGGSRILVIDDESDSRIVLRQYLEDLGCEVRTVGQGQKGLVEARAWRPHLITLDLRLPEMDGTEVLRLLASDAQLSGIPVVVISIVASENRSRLAPAACILDKPVSRESLAEVLGPLLRAG